MPMVLRGFRTQAEGFRAKAQRVVARILILRCFTNAKIDMP